MDPSRRHVGISASSTTSRSTTKTSSSPYRSDTQLRHTSTSTSNYNSTSDMPSYIRGFDSGLHRHREGNCNESYLGKPGKAMIPNVFSFTDL
jgi:cadherin EGF LAG seven-pass G-type receptor 1